MSTESLSETPAELPAVPRSGGSPTNRASIARQTMIQGSKRTSNRSTFITTAFDMQAMLDSRKRFMSSSASTRSDAQDGRPPSNDSSSSDKSEGREKASAAVIEEKDEMEELEEEIRKSHEELKLDLHLDGLDINQLAVDGKMMSTVLDEVLLKFGLDSKVESKLEKKGKKTKEELKINIQNHIIIQLGKRMEKMQSVIDDLTGKLEAASNDQKRVKRDRDDVRRRLIAIQKDLAQQLKDAQLKNSRREMDDELISNIITDIKKKSNVSGIREEMSLIPEVSEDVSSARNSDVSTLKKRMHGMPDGMALIGEDAEPGSESSSHMYGHILDKNPSLGKKGYPLPAISGQEYHAADASSENEDETGGLRIHKNTLLEIRHRVDLLESRKRFEPPTRLGVALRTLVTDDDVTLANPYEKALQRPYQLDASNQQSPQMKMLIRQARHRVAYLNNAVASQTRQLLMAQSPQEYIDMLHTQLTESMGTLQLCLDVLCEEQMYAWKWRSRSQKSLRQLGGIRTLFDRSRLEAQRLRKKEWQVMHGVVTEEDFELVNTGNLKEAAEVLNKKKGKEKHRGLNTAETLLYVRSGNHQPAPASLDQRAGGIASTRPGTGTKPSTPGLLQRKYSSSGSVGTRRGSTMLDGAAKRRDFESSPRSSTWSLPAEE